MDLGSYEYTRPVPGVKTLDKPLGDSSLCRRHGAGQQEDMLRKPWTPSCNGYVCYAGRKRNMIYHVGTERQCKVDARLTDLTQSFSSLATGYLDRNLRDGDCSVPAIINGTV